MPRPNKPWYRKERKRWYVKIDGKAHNLGTNKREAMQRFHELMASPKQRASTDSVISILDDFLGFCHAERAPDTVKFYTHYCQSFADSYGNLPVSELTTAHVTEWLNANSNWNSSSKNAAIRAIQRAFNWAVKNRGLKYNPVHGMDKPTPTTRTSVLTPDEFEAILSHVHDQAFRDLLIVSWDSGARPQEIKQLEARHVQLHKCRAIIPADEAKKGIQRAIYYPSDRSLAIIDRLTKQYPRDVIFRNLHGNK